jgi:hypothetical protein
MSKLVSKGYLVVFNGTSNGCDFFCTLEEAQNIRDMVAGGGIIYNATLEKIGYNTFPIRGTMVRKSDGTPL